MPRILKPIACALALNGPQNQSIKKFHLGDKLPKEPDFAWRTAIAFCYGVGMKATEYAGNSILNHDYGSRPQQYFLNCGRGGASSVFVVTSLSRDEVAAGIPHLNFRALSLGASSCGVL